MKKILALLICALLTLGTMTVAIVSAEESKGAPTGFTVGQALYAHAVTGSEDGEAWQAWQSEHDEDMNEHDPSVRYFFLPTSADESKADIYNGYSEAVTVAGTTIPAGETATVSYVKGENYTVAAGGSSYTLKFMKSNAEAAIYINNSNADGNGAELMNYLNSDKANSATATGAIVTPDGKIDNTPVKKIKGRGNTSWGKPKKGYNVTYDKKVSIAGMEKNKKYSLLANYQDDSLSRNRFLYDLSDAVGMPYASDSRYIDLYVNGFYWGSYQIAEKVEPGSLVPEVDDEGYLEEDGETIKKDFSFIVEVDASASDEDYWFSSNNMKVTIKSPELDPDQAGYDDVKKYIRRKFNSLYSAFTSEFVDLSMVADVESMTKLYLINELGKNWDSGVSSTFFTYKQDENGKYKFYGSPVWDYDNSLGNAVGVGNDLRTMGVNDYTQYTGWWCKYKGTSRSKPVSDNIMARLSLDPEVQAIAPQIWFEDFVPAIQHFSGEKPSDTVDKELYQASRYYELIKDSAAMNYTSGWLLYTSGWVADHSALKRATYNETTKKMVVDKTTTRYAQNFDGAFSYARDWMTSRAAWLSEQFAPNYVPTVKPTEPPTEAPTTEQPTTEQPTTEQPTTEPPTEAPEMVLIGDVDGSGKVDVMDATMLQMIVADLVPADAKLRFIADANGDGFVTITDATTIQIFAAEIETNTGNTGKTLPYTAN